MTSEKAITITIPPEYAGQRLDKALAQCVPDMSRSRLQQLVDEGCIEPVAASSLKVKGGEVFKITIPDAIEAEPKPEIIPLDIVFEDSDLLVINKPAGLVVHPGAGNWEGTLVNALLAHCGDSLSGIGGVKRPGIVHRLDKETSGLMIVAKNDRAHAALSAQLQSRELSRIYNAVIWGVPNPSHGVIEGNIGRSRANRQKMAVLDAAGREAITEYSIIKNFGMMASLVECRLQTGRTHQIRVHLTHIGHSLLGDPVYGHASPVKAVRTFGKNLGEGDAEIILKFPRQALHAMKIGFIHPKDGKLREFSSKLPDDMQELVNVLEKI